jgi:methylthioribose-1-phosphate isomerase
MTVPADSPSTPQSPLAVDWVGGLGGHIRIIDQTRLPAELVYLDCRDVETLWEAIHALRVRGAPAIGVAAAMGAALAAGSSDADDPASLLQTVLEATRRLRASRPTAVNLFWALDRMDQVARASCRGSADDLRRRLLAEAIAIRNDDARMCKAIGEFGAALIEKGSGVLTHCNAGALATADYGTALSVLFHAHEQGRLAVAYVDETRPLLQGSRLTAWELRRRSIPTVLLCDNMAASLMKSGKVQAVVVGADRIAANGDFANKIGTYGVAVLAKAHAVPFYVAAPTTTFDFATPSGDAIPIEFRDPREVTHGMGVQTAPDDVEVYNPAFDVTPAEFVDAFVTDQGVVRPPYAENLPKALRGGHA